MRHKLESLSEYEKKEAERNHNLVYAFLRTYNYSIDEFYNIAVMGFLRGIQVYNRREDLRNKYNQTFICWKYMRAEMGNHFRTEQAQKRGATERIISLDAEYSEAENLYNLVGEKSAEEELLEAELLNDILENLSEIQRNILKMKLEGFKSKEVYLLLEISSSTFYKEMNRIKVVVENLVG